MLVEDLVLDEIAEEASEVLDVDQVFVTVEIFDKDIRVVAEYGVHDEKFRLT